MNSSNMPQPESSHPSIKGVPQSLLVAVTTTPVLAGIVLGRALAQVAQEFGQLSEELFRGDRLPLLKFPSQLKPAPDLNNDD
jgi:hypothetical protein